MAIHFTETELAERRAKACAALEQRGLAGLLMFRQESMYHLTGYDTFGYVHFQAMFLNADGRLTLLTRAPDRIQAMRTSVVEDIRIWTDRHDSDPYSEVRSILDEHGVKGEKIGVEFESYGLTAAKGMALMRRLDGFCATEDASMLVSELRLIKSPAELEYVRRAAALADEALSVCREMAAPGVFEGDILAAMQGAVYRGGGDDPANEHVIGSGEDALLCRYHTGRRSLSAQDQLTVEFSGVFRHYHAALMRTIPIGAVPRGQVEMHAACRDSLLAAEETLKPGRPIGAVFDAHAKALDEAGYREARMNACGYALGATFAPNWMDWPMFYRGNPVVAAPGMVFFIHIIVFDAATGLAMTLGRTSEVTENGAKPLSEAPIDLTAR